MANSKHLKNSSVTASSSNKCQKKIRSLVLKIAYPMHFVDEAPYPRCDFGSWYLSPEHHFFESFIVSLVGLLIIIFTASKTSSFIASNITKNSAAEFGNIIDILIKYGLILDFIMHIIYKFMNKGPLPMPHDMYKLLTSTKQSISISSNNCKQPSFDLEISDLQHKCRGLLWLILPCPVNHVILILFFWFPQLQTARANQFLMTMSYGALSALIFPDNQHCQYIGEYFHFYFQHYLLFLTPFYHFLFKCDKCESVVQIIAVCQDFAVAVLFHFIVLEIASIISGANLNYMLSPPPEGPAKLFGKKYRVASTVFVFIACIVTGFIIPSMLQLFMSFVT